MKNNRGYLSILLALIALTSCHKNDSTPTTPGFRLFTNKMEITDASIKTKFFNKSSSRFSYKPIAGPTDGLTFIAPDTVRFDGSSMRFSVVKNNTQYLFYSPQVVQGSYNNILYDMLKYNAPKIPISFQTGYQYLTSEVRVGYVVASKVQLSYLDYYYIKSNGIGQGGYTGLLYNELNENVIAEITGTDTLAIQAGQVSVLIH